MLFQNYTKIFEPWIKLAFATPLPSPPTNFLSISFPLQCVDCTCKNFPARTKWSFLWNDVQWVLPSAPWDSENMIFFICQNLNLSTYWYVKRKKTHVDIPPQRCAEGRGRQKRRRKGEFSLLCKGPLLNLALCAVWCGIYFDLRLLCFENSPSPFSRASICSWVKDVLFLCSFRFSWSRIWASSESSPLELMELVFSPPPSCCWQPSATKRIGQ